MGIGARARRLDAHGWALEYAADGEWSIVGYHGSLLACAESLLTRHAHLLVGDTGNVRELATAIREAGRAVAAAVAAATKPEEETHVG